MDGLELIRVVQPGGGHDLRKRIEGIPVKVVDSLGLVGNHERLLSLLVLRGDSDRAGVRMASLGLDTADCEHETAC